MVSLLCTLLICLFIIVYNIVLYYKLRNVYLIPQKTFIGAHFMFILYSLAIFYEQTQSNQNFKTISFLISNIIKSHFTIIIYYGYWQFTINISNGIYNIRRDKEYSIYTLSILSLMMIILFIVKLVNCIFNYNELYYYAFWADISYRLSIQVINLLLLIRIRNRTLLNLFSFNTENLLFQIESQIFDKDFYKCLLNNLTILRLNLLCAYCFVLSCFSFNILYFILNLDLNYVYEFYCYVLLSYILLPNSLLFKFSKVNISPGDEFNIIKVNSYLDYNAHKSKVEFVKYNSIIVLVNPYLKNISILNIQIGKLISE